MKIWAAEYGKCVNQKSVRQETTQYKAGTLPLNMYQTRDIPRDRIVFVPSQVPDVVADDINEGDTGSDAMDDDDVRSR